MSRAKYMISCGLPLLLMGVFAFVGGVYAGRGEWVSAAALLFAWLYLAALELSFDWDRSKPTGGGNG